MNSEKKSFLAEFSRRAVQRLQDKKVPKYRTLHIPSLATDMRFRNLSYDEITECMNMEDTGDPNRSEVQEIAMQVMELSGVLNSTKVTVVDQLKN